MPANPRSIKKSNPGPQSGANWSFLRSPKVIIGGVLAAVLLTACASGAFEDDDDCASGPTEDTIFAAGSSGIRIAPPDQAQTEAVPPSGGFGTHLASCGG